MTNTLSDWIERLESEAPCSFVWTDDEQAELLAFLKGLGEGRSFEIWVCPECGWVEKAIVGLKGQVRCPLHTGKTPFLERITVSDGFLKGTKERLDEVEGALTRIANAESIHTAGPWAVDVARAALAANREAK